VIRTYVRNSVSVIAVAAALGGCSLFHHHDNYYSKAVEARPLEVPPDLDTPPATNELNVPTVGGAAATTSSSASSSVSSMTSPPAGTPAASGVALTGAGLHVADSVDHTWQRVGVALDRAQLGTVSERDATGHSYTLEVSGLRATAAPAPEPEHHWYTRILHPFGGGNSSSASNSQPVSGRLTVKVIGDGDGSRVDVEGTSNDTSATEAARRVLDALRDRLS
jgi:uncharacterized lipoprotein